MRIEKVSYVVKAGNKSFVMTMTKVVDLAMRDLVLVKKNKKSSEKKDSIR